MCSRGELSAIRSRILRCSSPRCSSIIIFSSERLPADVGRACIHRIRACRLRRVAPFVQEHGCHGRRLRQGFYAHRPHGQGAHSCRFPRQGGGDVLRLYALPGRMSDDTCRAQGGKDRLGEDGKRLQVLFVTVDPERDTQELLANYVPAFDPSFLGLYGDPAATARLAKDFRVFYQKSSGKTPDSYTVDHTAGSYVFDPLGRLRLFVRNGNAASLASDVRILLNASG